LKLSDLKKNKYIGEYVGESDSSKEEKAKRPVEEEELDERQLALRKAIRKLELAESAMNSLSDTTTQEANDSYVEITPTRDDVIEALQKLREAGGKVSPPSTEQPTGGNLGSGNQPTSPSGEEPTEHDIPIKEYDPGDPSKITFDDYMYAADIVKYSIPPAEAFENSEDLMPKFTGGHVRYGDNVFVDENGDVVTLEEGDPEPVEPCIPSGSWFKRFLLKLVLNEGLEVDFIWLYGKISLCPMTKIWNTIWSKLKGIKLSLPWPVGDINIGEKLFGWIPYIYLPEEAAYWLAKKKQETMCRPVYLLKSYSCHKISRNAFLEAHPNDRLAQEVVSEIDSPVAKKFRDSDVLEEYSKYNENTADAILAFVNMSKQLFTGVTPPTLDQYENIQYQIDVQVPKDLFILCGSNTLSSALNAFENGNRDKGNGILNKRIMRLFNMRKSRDLETTIADISEYRMNTGFYYVEDGIFPGDR